MKRLLAAVWLCVVSGLPALGQGEGIFADFSTSLGNFTVRLDYERAPRAAASFVGLATGEAAWADAQGNLWAKPFYDGTIFHRVVKDSQTNGIAIQGGGVPTFAVDTNTGAVSTNFSNAGYPMIEAVHNGLLHSNGVIAMANSGPNTDGSQFFVTTTNVPGWDGKYTVFGHVVSGMAAVEAIAAVPVQGVQERPVEDVWLHSVAIRRVGAAAEAFDAAAQGVPVLEDAPIGLATSGTNLLVSMRIEGQTQMAIRESADLAAWESSNLGLYVGSDFTWTNSVSRALLGDKYFFHFSRIRYTEPVSTPAGNRGKKFTFWWNEQPLKYEVWFYTNASFGHVGRTTVGTSVVVRQVFSTDGWTRNAYSGRLYFHDDLNRQYVYSLGFVPGLATNRFTGYWWPMGGDTSPMTGVFTMEE